jgi:hypothetical protein
MDASGFIREVAGQVASELASEPRGRTVGLSVEVWPDRDVLLHTRRGHTLRIFVHVRDELAWVCWERSEPGTNRRKATTTGDLGSLDRTDAEQVRAFVASWLTSPDG